MNANDFKSKGSGHCAAILDFGFGVNRTRCSYGQYVISSEEIQTRFYEKSTIDSPGKPDHDRAIIQDNFSQPVYLGAIGKVLKTLQGYLRQIDYLGLGFYPDNPYR